MHNDHTITIHPSSHIRKGTSDLIVLKYMTQRVRLTLHQLEQPTMPAHPLIYNLQERHGRIHRIALYQCQELLQRKSLNFVGFISRKQKQLDSSITDEIHAIDQKLVAELIAHPSVLSYSSLELRTGIWCNLVLLSDNEAKRRFQGTQTHAYAAHQLAPRYYEWIRLHSGSMPNGLFHETMRVQKTRYYTFQPTQHKPSIQELVYTDTDK